MHRIDALRGYLARDYLCPYAAIASGAGAFVELAGTFASGRQVTRELLALAEARSPGSALVLVAERDAPDEAALRAETERVLRLLWERAVRLAEPAAREAEVRQVVDLMVRQTLGDSLARPFLRVREQPLFLITLGACYPARHTRHAPHDCWVLTRVAEVAEVARRQPGAVAGIRQRIVERMGALYDADEPVLPASAMRGAGDAGRVAPCGASTGST